MSFLDRIINEDEGKERARRMNGVVTGIVTTNNDPEKLGRVKVTFPWLSEDNETDWVRVASPMAGSERGMYFIPEVEDEMLVAFEHGDINRPFVIGALWNIQDNPPEDNQDEQNNIRRVTSRSGHQLIFDDKDSEEKIQILTQGGHEIMLDDSTGSEKVLIQDKTGNNSVEIDSVANSISIKSQLNLSIKATNIEIESTGTMKIKSGATMTIQGALVNIN